MGAAPHQGGDIYLYLHPRPVQVQFILLDNESEYVRCGRVMFRPSPLLYVTGWGLNLRAGKPPPRRRTPLHCRRAPHPYLNQIFNPPPQIRYPQQSDATKILTFSGCLIAPRRLREKRWARERKGEYERGSAWVRMHGSLSNGGILDLFSSHRSILPYNSYRCLPLSGLWFLLLSPLHRLTTSTRRTFAPGSFDFIGTQSTQVKIDSKAGNWGCEIP